ncbi:hypothetical protein GGR53DRAFT_462908 [Hypoxylon sp. FL1150]|nr:hypothetical protein GGR53DRAFT_462908 [Hypoxylon sp. FL1150]
MSDAPSDAPNPQALPGPMKSRLDVGAVEAAKCEAWMDRAYELLTEQETCPPGIKEWMWEEVFLFWDTNRMPAPIKNPQRSVAELATQVGTISEDLPTGRDKQRKEAEAEHQADEAGVGTPPKRKQAANTVFKDNKVPRADKKSFRKKGSPALVRPGFLQHAKVITWSPIDMMGVGVPWDKIRFENANADTGSLGYLTCDQRLEAMDVYDHAQKQFVCVYNNRLVKYLIRRYLYVTCNEQPQDAEQQMRLPTEDDFKEYDLLRKVALSDAIATMTTPLKLSDAETRAFVYQS